MFVNRFASSRHVYPTVSELKDNHNKIMGVQKLKLTFLYKYTF